MIFFNFQDGGRLPFWILEMLKFYWLVLFIGSICITVSNCRDIASFCFSKMAAVCHFGLVWGISEEYLVVFIVVQNLVEIDRGVLII